MNVHFHRLRPSLLVLLAVWLSPFSNAVDGVREIGEVCAIETGCFPGDAVGLPVTITEPGSYILTSNITIPPPFRGAGETDKDEGRGGGSVCSTSVSCVIDILADNVTVDLNGFALDGSISFGQAIAGSSAEGVEVRNGTIANFFFSAVFLGDRARVDGLRVPNVGLAGAGDPIIVGDQSVVTNNIITDGEQGGSAILVQGGGCLVSGNVVSDTLSAGISVSGSGCTVSNNTIRNADWFPAGIRVAGAGTIKGNTIDSTAGKGIVAGDGSTVTQNSVSGADDVGLDLGALAGYGNNVITGNNGGVEIQVTGGQQIATNLCGSDTVCP